MSTPAKRKNQEITDFKVKGNVKKRKQDITWITEGLTALDPFLTLKRFIEEAEAFNSKREGLDEDDNEQDIVYHFFQNECTGKEFLSLLEVEVKRKATEVTLIFNALETIIVRMASDLSEYRNIGMQLANSILQSHMKTIYLSLAPSSNANQIKATLRLLTAMVTLGHLTAREVISRFDFSHACVAYILQRRSLSDLPDIRSTYIMFITSFIIEEDSMLLRTIAENSDILQPVFEGLLYDSVGIVQLFLNALREKVAMSSLLSKTHKLRIFNSATCQQLCTLFLWLGPQRAPKGNMEKKEGDKTKNKNIDEDNEEDSLAVAETVHSLLLVLCSSHKYGLAFADYSIGFSGKNKNFAVHNLLMALQEFWELHSPKLVEIQSTLVIRTLQSCPDLMRWYLREVTDDLGDVRSTGAWLTLSNLINRVLDAQNLELIFNPKEKFSVKQQSSRAATLITPPVINQEFFVNALAFDDLNVKLSSCQLLQTVLRKTQEFLGILTNSPRAEMYSAGEKEAISASVKETVAKLVPSSTLLMECCTKWSSFKDEKKGVHFWTILLELMTLYSDLGLKADEEKEAIPAAQLLTSVMEYVKDSKEEKQVLEQLQLAVFKFVSLSTDVLSMSGPQQEVLVAHLVSCAVTAQQTELRHCSSAFLRKIFALAGISPVDSVEFNVWLLALKQHPEAASFLADVCTELVREAVHYEEQLHVIFPAGTTAPCSPLLLSSWRVFKASETDQLGLYLAAVTSGLLLTQFETQQSFSSFITAAMPKKLMKNKSLKALLKTWSEAQDGVIIDGSLLGLSPPAAILFNCVYSETVDLASVKEEWTAATLGFSQSPDESELVLYHGLSYLSATKDRKDEQMHVFELVSSLFNGDEAVRTHLTAPLLEHPSSLGWFDPADSSDQFIVQFTSLVRDALGRTRIEHNQQYKHKLVQCIRHGVNQDAPKVKKGKKKAQPAPPSVDTQLLVTLFDLFDLKIQEIDPLITMIVDLKPAATTRWLPLLEFLLVRAARLRLGGADQRIEWTTFHRVLDLYVALQVPVSLRRGVHDLTSVCPEFLDHIEVFTAVLNSCLESDSDQNQLCLLLIQNSDQLSVAFSNWCLENETKFKNINWRLQILPYFSSGAENTGNDTLSMINRNLSRDLCNLIVNREEYQQVGIKFENFAEFISTVISRYWNAEQCREIAAKLLSQHKTGLSCSQFVDVGRKGSHHDLHIKLCLRTAVWLFKNNELPDGDELKKLAEELDWLTKNSQVDYSKLILEGSSWSKFVKYTLRFGLRTLDGEESHLPPLALQLLINVWNLLSKNVSDEVLSAAQQVYEMISSHSDFMSVILDEEGEYRGQKKLLLELLSVLIQVNPKLCQSGHVPLLLASYQASRSYTDQLILRLLHSYEKNGVQLSPFKPYLWGSAAAAHYSIQRGSSTRLATQPETGEILALLDNDKLLKTAYQFPIEMSLNSMEMHAESDACYDPRFLIPLLCHILSSEYVVQCAKFTQSGAASVLFAALSSDCGEMRAIGWLSLSRFYDQLQSATAWPERCLWLHLIECLRLGATEQFPHRQGDRQFPPKLSNLITLFVAKAAVVLRDPSHPMYRPINNFILVKAVMDVTQVPEFFVLLHSSELPMQRSQYRTFLLTLLRDGLKNRMDYLVCARRRVFRLLLSLQPSGLLTDHSSKSLILEVVQSALRNPIIAYDLILNRGLIMWLNGLIFAASAAGEAYQILKVVEVLWNTLYAHLLRKRNQQEKSEAEAVAELERELEVLESDEKNGQEAPQSQSKKPLENNRKPIWNLLPAHQQILPPSLTLELIQLLINLWRSFSLGEVDKESFEIYTRILCAACRHLHESKIVIKSAQDANPNSVHYVSPSRILSLPLLEQLVDLSPRYISSLPDLGEHLSSVKKLPLNPRTPDEITVGWKRRYNCMAKIQNVEGSVDIRMNLHMLLSLAECGV